MLHISVSIVLLLLLLLLFDIELGTLENNHSPFPKKGTIEIRYRS